MISGGVVGIDTIRAGGRCGSVDQRAPGWRFSAETTPFGLKVTHRVRKLECGFALDVSATRDGASAFVEGSVPKLLHGNNVAPASVRESVEVVSRALLEAQQFCSLEVAPQINRLDAVRDFPDMETMGALLLGLSSVPARGRKVRDLYREPALGNAQTLMTRNRSRAVRAYNKGEECKLDEAKNRLRVECQTRTRALRTMGIGRLDRMRESDVERCARDGFDWAGLGAPLAPMDDALVKVLGADDLTVPARMKLIGFMVACSHGMEAQIDRRRRSEYRRDLERVGAFSAEVTNVVRLDFDRGLVEESA